MLVLTIFGAVSISYCVPARCDPYSILSAGRTKMTTLYRAAKDDYLSQGMSFAETIEAARVYQSNPGFGGAHLYTCDATGSALDLRGYSVADAAAELGCADPGSIGVDEWLPRTQSALDAAQAAGYSWVLVSESYPEQTTTWIWVGDSCDDPELTEI